jgi:hypothetical protein
MLNLRTFVDESGTEVRGPKDIFLMGGWIADVETWERFSTDWDKVLRSSPAIAYFSHREAKALSGQFTGWSVRDANLKILSLAKVVDRHINPERQHYGIATGMRPEVLRILLKRSPATQRQIRGVLKLTTPYDFCFHSLVGLVLVHQVLTLHSTETVDFIFDSHPSFDACAKLFKEMKSKLIPKITAIAGTITEGDDKQLAPLQAADLLVGQMTANLKLGKPEKPFQILARGDNRILFAPLRWGEDAALSGFASAIEVFNVYWSSLIIEKSKSNRKRGTIT